MDMDETFGRLDCYECEEDECELPAEQSSVCENAVYCWKSTVREEDGNERNARGCVSSGQQGQFMCHNRMRTGNSKYHIECCNKVFCNHGAFPLLHTPEIPKPDQTTSTAKMTAEIVTPLLTVVFIILAIIWYYRRSKKCYSSTSSCNESQTDKCEELRLESETNEPPQFDSSINVAAVCSYISPELKVTFAGESTLKECFDGQSLTGGSGSGHPLLTRRTFSRQITLVNHLNKGRFSQKYELWRGIWQGESVTVKIYPSRLETLWARETEVYTRLLPSKHNNILGYVGSDTTSTADCTQLWLVTNYHSNGSLENYLSESQLQHNEMFRLCSSLTDGLLYLHTEILGTQGKVSIAHGNLNSKNVFVKNDGNCVISDFGHAVTQERLDRGTHFYEHASKRYMSPELLERAFDPRSIVTFRQADIYSLGLVFWEICRRCMNMEKIVLDYAIPYYEWLADDDREPTIEEMCKLVVINELRPEIPEHWQSDETLAGMGVMIKECWHAKADARLPILRIKKTLLKLASANPDIDLSVADIH